MRAAYGVQARITLPGGADDRIVGGPVWVQTYRFDITARTAREISREQVYSMLRTLLEDRFKLVVAREQRERHAYTLRLARADGRVGPDLRKAADDCATNRPADPLARSKLMPRPSNGTGPSSGGTCLTIDGVTDALDRTLNATVINETGLNGRWDYVISHARLQSGTVRGPNGPEERPSIFVAVQEQLGLKLERRSEPGSYEVLVIKSVELPSEN